MNVNKMKNKGRLITHKSAPLIFPAIIYFVLINSCDAGMKTGVVYWPDTDRYAPGQVAETCTFSWSDTRPFQQTRTLIVDNTAPVGTVLHRWGYGEFADYQFNCTGGELGSSSNFSSGTATTYFSIIPFSDSASIDGGEDTPIPTNINGIGLKLYYTFHTVGDDFSTGTNVYTSQVYPPDAGVEYYAYSRTAVVFKHWTRSKSVSGIGSGYIFNPASTSFSFRAELVKTGDISSDDYGRSLTVSMSDGSLRVFTYKPEVIETGDNFSLATQFSGNGITITSPACMLNNENYNINMGDWVAYAWGGSVRRGDEKLVDISLKCTGAANNVYFRFEDAGSATASPDKNIRVYEGASSGADVVDGLEIELLYNGEHVNVDGTTLTNIGTRGNYVSTNNSETQLYSSLDTASFTARFLQNGPISYLGPVTGKVNMWVTYE
ncbi:TPA: hypothetical protein MYP81_000541 [Citrobacter farmeri]|uniref:hypothetical protein n=1 Tax=Citrobacter farmeri TaxID=67824 RepID=UPI001A2599FB|nr:hypothetical protein [Citrobacter farmeri]MBU5646517.1 hypothetical protein [Pluralibacter sp. S54_ASV_43]HAT3754558.1 hypothetical protein [Citrobacter amalonaticus]QZE47203.1 hypothetical protein Cf24236_2449 [Citrobacter farmeri]HCB1598600.1 hypothetical protein [Citrobacter farmeri]HCB1652628.1 hypothetical protein [Citrobacter farmeri]